MAVKSMKTRALITERRNLVDGFLRGCKQPMTCVQVCEALGLSKSIAQAAIRALCDGGAAESCGETRTPTYNGGFNKTTLYRTTGKPYDHERATKIHVNNQKRDHYVEPEGGVIEKYIGPHHRLIRFGKKSPKGDGQSCDVAPYTGGCSLNTIY